MIGKRLFWFGVGVGVGAGATVETLRRGRRAVRRAGPNAVASRFQTSVRDLGRDLRVAAAEGRSTMREREAELRDVP